MSELECKICFNQFNSDLNMPRMLQCGHTLCTQCLYSILDNPKSCPNCRKETFSDNVNDYPVNYILLEIKDSTKKFMSTKENFIQKCREKLQKRQNDHLDLKALIHSQKDNIDLNLSLIESNEDQLNKLLDVCDPFDKYFERMIAEIDKNFEIIRSQVSLIDSHLITTVSLKSKDFETSSAFLQELHEMVVVENKKVVALLRIGGVPQGAKLSFMDDLLFINAFERSQEEEENPTTVCFQDLQNILLRSGKAESIFGFLDLFYREGSLSRKVFIEINKSTSDLGSQFLKLCTGELGISYKGREYDQKYGDITNLKNVSTDWIIRLNGVNWKRKEVDNFSAYFLKKNTNRTQCSKNCCYLLFNSNGSFDIFRFDQYDQPVNCSNVVGAIVDEKNDFACTFKDASFKKIANCGIAIKFSF